MDEGGKSLVYTFLWLIWYRKNQGVFQNHKLECHQVLVKMFQNMPKENIQDGEAGIQQTKNVFWKEPTYGRYKINFDTSVSKNGGTWIVFISRDKEGHVLASTTKLLDFVLEPREVEAYAFRWEICLAVELLFENVIFETDCLQQEVPYKVDQIISSPSSFPLNKGHSSSVVRSLEAHLGHVHPACPSSGFCNEIALRTERQCNLTLSESVICVRITLGTGAKDSPLEPPISGEDHGASVEDAYMDQ
ncbi:hypothetical protein JHK85_020024 [Glycine max]|nr:hypothetical protein JHK85_020024 [Glycine max]